MSLVNASFANLLEELREAHYKEINVLRNKLRHQDELGRRANTGSSSMDMSAFGSDNSAQGRSSQAQQDVSQSERFRLNSASSMSSVGINPCETKDVDAINSMRVSDSRGSFCASIRLDGSNRFRSLFTPTQSSKRVSRPTESQTCFQFQLYRWRLRELLCSPWFEAGVSVILLTCAIAMALEAQYEGVQLGEKLKYRRMTEPVQNQYPFAETTLHAFNWAFGVIFTTEVVFKMLALDKDFFDLSNVIDCAIAIAFVCEKQNLIGTNAAVLRCVRLVRLARLVRFVRIIESFDALFLMTTAIKGSFTVLGWALLLLSILQLIIAVLVCQGLRITYFEKGDIPLKERQAVFEYFGTFSRSFLSMFELTFANWAPICRLLSENVSEWFAYAVLIHKMFIGFAMLGVINGVFIQETFQVAATDDAIMVRQKQKATKMHQKKMKNFFNAVDVSGDGNLTVDEFHAMCVDPDAKLWLASMDLDTNDVQALFELIDADADGTITIDELVRGVSRLKGHARSLDAVQTLCMLKDTNRILAECQLLHHKIHKAQENTLSQVSMNSLSPRSAHKQVTEANYVVVHL